MHVRRMFFTPKTEADLLGGKFKALIASVRVEFAITTSTNAYIHDGQV